MTERLRFYCLSAVSVSLGQFCLSIPKSEISAIIPSSKYNTKPELNIIFEKQILLNFVHLIQKKLSVCCVSNILHFSQFIGGLSTF
jgi:hypothetical protein